MIKRYTKFLFAGAIFFLVGSFFFNIILNHFYTDAPYILDSGWYADLIWHNQLNVRNPGAVIEGPNDRYYFRVHFSPLFGLLSSLSYVTHFDRITWFGLYNWVAFGLLGIFVYLILSERNSSGSVLHYLIAAAVSTAVAWSGLTLRIASYPHTEILSVSLVIGWFWAVFSSRYFPALILFALAVLVREDIGFHIGGIVITYLTISWTSEFATGYHSPSPNLRRTLTRYGAAGIVYSIIAFAVIRIFYPGSDAFVRIYSGSPPYAHLNFELISTRLTQIFVDKLEISLPMAFFTLVALLSRSLLPLTGIIAFIPWLVISALAQSEAAGTLSLYYGFPILIGQIVSLYLMNQAVGERLRIPAKILAVPIFIYPTFYSWGDFEPFVNRGINPASAESISETRALRNFIKSRAITDPEMKVDIAVAALEPRAFSSALNQVHREDSFKDKKLVIFNAQGLQVREADDCSVAIGARYHYRWMSSDYILASTEPITDVGAILLSTGQDSTLRPSVLLTQKR